VVEWCDSDDVALAAEERWIATLRANDRRFGFNLSAGGRGGKSPSPESREKVAAAKRGKPRSDETRRKLSAAHRGMKHSPAAKAKMSAARAGRSLSEEHRAAIKAAWERRRASPPSPKEIAVREMLKTVNVGRRHDEATRNKMRQAHLALPARSVEWRANIAKSKTGKKLSPEMKKLRAERMAAKRAVKEET
jgi:hypothetical protein